MKTIIKRLPVIRHLRWLYFSWRVQQHYTMWHQLGSLAVNRHLDDEVLDQIWKGER
jgi:hypothetical protein